MTCWRNEVEACVYSKILESGVSCKREPGMSEAGLPEGRGKPSLTFDAGLFGEDVVVL